MPSYKSNVKSVIGSLVQKLEGVKANVVDKVVREVAVDLVGSNTRRIHNEAKAVDGSDIGNYTDGSYKKRREKRDKRTDKVNLDFSGKLSKEFVLEAVGRSEIGVGFLTDYGANLQEVLEEKYNKIIWGVTQQDEVVAGNILKNRINKYLNG
jgi:hypothetical protein